MDVAEDEALGVDAFCFRCTFGSTAIVSCFPVLVRTLEIQPKRIMRPWKCQVAQCFGGTGSAGVQPDGVFGAGGESVAGDA